MRKLNRIFKSEKALALLPVIILSLFIGLLAYFISSQQLVQLKKIKYFKASDGRDRIVEILELALKDPNALANSRVQIEGQSENSTLLNCLYRGDDAGGRPEPNCVVGPSIHEPTWYPFVLFMAYPMNQNPVKNDDGSYSFSAPDLNAQRLSGIFYSTSGTPCASSVTEPTDACPLQVMTEFSPQCRGMTECDRAHAMNIRFKVKWAMSKNGLGLFRLKDFLSKEMGLGEWFLKHLY